MPTPVGPAPKDSNDPDLWDWDPEGTDADDNRIGRQPSWGKTLGAAILLVAVIVLVLASTI